MLTLRMLAFVFCFLRHMALTLFRLFYDSAADIFDAVAALRALTLMLLMRCHWSPLLISAITPLMPDGYAIRHVVSEYYYYAPLIRAMMAMLSYQLLSPCRCLLAPALQPLTLAACRGALLSSPNAATYVGC